MHSSGRHAASNVPRLTYDLQEGTEAKLCRQLTKARTFFVGPAETSDEAVMDSSDDVCSASGKPQTNRAPGDDTTGHDINNSNLSSCELSSSQVATLTQRILHFLSTAGNDTLLAVFAALAVATFVILGRLGLLLIGLVAGVILHAHWDGAEDDLRNGGLDTSHHRRRRELGIEVANRLLEWQSQRTTEDGAHGQRSVVTKAESIHDTELSFSSFGPATAAALTALTDAIIKDYVT